MTLNIRARAMLKWKALDLVILMCSLTTEAIRWPAGKYGIPKPESGCPWTEGFTWKEGWRSQDTNGKNSNNSRSAEFHLDGQVDSTKVRRSFCLKNVTTGDDLRPKWPPGQYCFYKRGRCPDGLTGGSVTWDDENINNSNSKGGILPSGKYNQDTEIRFCCRKNGSKSVPILLPTITPFFLLAYQSAKCQMVKWAVANLEWIHYDTEHDNNKDRRNLPYPYDAGRQHPTIYYCYYRGCNFTLTGVNDSFHSPNYPGNYPDGQFCSWKITVSPGQQMHLMFANFSLQWNNNTDALSIYDGENETGNSLGVFYGRHPPPKEGINSLSNHMFVMFKSDDSVSDTGFSAFYCEGKCPEATSLTTPTARTSEMTSPPGFSPKTLLTLEKATPATDGPLDESAGKGQRKQTKRRGLDVVAVVVPAVVLVVVVALLFAGLFCWKRRKAKKENQELPNTIIYSSGPVYRDRTVGNISSGVYSALTIGGGGCTTEENELCTELKEMDNVGKNEMFEEQRTENPIYETAEDDAVFNLIYDVKTTGEAPMSADNPCYDSGPVYTDLTVANISSGVFGGLTIGNGGCPTEESELHTELKEMDNVGKNEIFEEQRTENPTYETAEDDAVLNPIYEVSSM